MYSEPEKMYSYIVFKILLNKVTGLGENTRVEIQFRNSPLQQTFSSPPSPPPIIILRIPLFMSVDFST